MDIGPDGVCDSCIFGNHCNKLNGVIDGRPAGNIEREVGDVKEIQWRLKDLGFRKGKDFVARKTSHVLYDLGGKSLTGTNKGTPKTVTFESLIVRAAALRKVAEGVRHIWTPDDL